MLKVKSGQSVREKITGRYGEVLENAAGCQLVRFVDLAGHCRLDGTVDSGERLIPNHLLEVVKGGDQ